MTSRIYIAFQGQNVILLQQIRQCNFYLDLFRFVWLLRPFTNAFIGVLCMIILYIIMP